MAGADQLDGAHDRGPSAEQFAGQAHGLVKVVSRDAVLDPHLVERRDHFARMRLFFGFCSTAARPSASSKGGMYIPNRASTVPSAAGFCSSALPSGMQSPCFLIMA